MPTLTIQKYDAKKMKIEIDLNQWEHLADVFGFYNPNFLKSIKQSLKESKEGKVRKVKSLNDIIK